MNSIIKAKPIQIAKREVFEAWQRVRANRGSAGIDGQTIADYEQKLSKNLYKLWNRMSSGSYFPRAVKRVEIPKADGGKRPLGIPTVNDRVAQEVVRKRLEIEVEPIFHNDSYAFRPKKTAQDAIAKCRRECWKNAWVLDVDIQKFFDTINHDLMLKAVTKHCREKWEVIYIERWLKAPIEHEDGNKEESQSGTPQGGVISPLLANLYLHYAFDSWMTRNHSDITFERFADDIVHSLSDDEGNGRIAKAT